MSHRRWSIFALLLLADGLCGEEPQPMTKSRLSSAQRFVEAKPTAEHWAGLAEMKRSADQRDPAAFASAVQQPSPQGVSFQELLCWRMLPVGPAQRGSFRREADKLKETDSAWRAVFDLYLLSEAQDRPALLQAVKNLPARLPDGFPSALGDTAHLNLLLELGCPRLQAGIEVVTSRDFGPLHALRDLDRALTREAEFLATSGRRDDARTILTARDRLRQSYLQSSRHLVERLFALNLLARADEASLALQASARPDQHKPGAAAQDRDLLLRRAKEIAYLNNPQALREAFARIDEERAWKLVIEPLLGGEVALIESPPDLAKLEPAQGIMNVRARKKSQQPAGVSYDGAVQVELGAVRIGCEHLTLKADASAANVALAGATSIDVRGLTAFPGGIRADRFTYDHRSGLFTFAGDVRLLREDSTLKLQECTVSRSGELSLQKSLINDFHKCRDVSEKLALLPDLTLVYNDDELPSEARYLLALNLLRPLLTWHAPYLPYVPPPERDRDENLIEFKRIVKELDRTSDVREDDRWREAMGGESWMVQDIPPDTKESDRKGVRQWNLDHPPAERQEPIARPRGLDYFWRLRDPHHKDVRRILNLLWGVTGEQRARAHRWISEIRRNNTVVTMDIPGGGAMGKTLPLVVDVRNGDQLSFKLYRVTRPDDLLWATTRIGIDFIYRDHGLVGPQRALEQNKYEECKSRSRTQYALNGEMKLPMPELKEEQLIHQWSVAVAGLKVLKRDPWRSEDRHHDWDDEEDFDAGYFDDGCGRHERRLHKDYRPGQRQPSSWRCDRIVEVPAAALERAGAYVLVAECNGQSSQVPLLINPLSVTLCRCRDGVFVLASDSDGAKPLAGADVVGQNFSSESMKGMTSTNKDGAAFLRVFAGGDRAVLIHHEGRFAIGGFGRVFDGIYKSEHEREREWWSSRGRHSWWDSDARDVSQAHIYQDGFVAAAYTDRPSYRPGQQVHFKLILRKLAADPAGRKQVDPLNDPFRAEDFEVGKNLTLPEVDQEVRFTVLDARGREAGAGTLKVNDFGTAAASITLSGEASLGVYSMRIRINDSDRIVPEVFAVKDYRLPSFEMQISGVPEKIGKATELSFTVSGKYNFGKPLAGGKVQARLVRGDRHAALARAEGVLDDEGKVGLTMELPPRLKVGRHFLICDLTDESGRNVSKSVAVAVGDDAAGKPAPAGLAALPRFVPIGKELEVATTAKTIWIDSASDCVAFAVVDGRATLRLPEYGWHRLTAEGEAVDLFAYGGNETLRDLEPDYADADQLEPQPQQREGQTKVPRARWVNLADFHDEDEDHPYSWRRWNRDREQDLFALFDRQHVEVGGKLRVLVYVPYKNARLLFTMEGRTVLDYFVTWTSDESGRYHVVEIPIKDRLLPNFYLQGRVLTGEGRSHSDLHRVKEAKEMAKKLRQGEEGLDPHWCRIDVLDSNRKTAGDRLKVDVLPERSDYRPGEMVNLKMKVSDRDGRPCAAEVSLGAVDASVYSLGEDRVATLSGFFAAPHEERRFLPKAWRSSVGNKWQPSALVEKQLRELAAKAAEAKDAQGQAIQSLSKAIEAVTDQRRIRERPVPLPLLGGQMPVAAVTLGRMRLDFRETACWQPQLRSGPDGIIDTSFRLPDSLTRYRLTALALTKQTEIGVGRAHVTASLPLAVQVILPRFAVEKDRLLAVGLIHNNTAVEQSCDIQWEVTGARAGDPEPVPAQWRSRTIGPKKVGTGRLLIPAHGTARVGLWLDLDQLGTASVALRAAAGKEADAETRTLPVHALGRPREVALSGQLLDQTMEERRKTGFSKQSELLLPDGFHADDLHLSLSCTDVAQALSGLEYLVEYPYGCIEQTMSRFLPAVMVKHAIERTSLKLPPDVAAKLPDVLARGLTRVYGFQHEDGSWGWFARPDDNNDPWTIYVAYGLARCQAAGTAVDPEVLARGCRYLQQRLQAGKISPTLTARAWYVLALAGHVDRKELEQAARQALKTEDDPTARCNLALACRCAGLSELGQRLWLSLSDWQPRETDAIALHLFAQISFKARWELCRVSANRLLAQRQGTRWHSTRATSWAIEALAETLRYLPEQPAVRRVQVWVNGSPALLVSDPADLRKLVWHLHLPGGRMSIGEGPVQIRMAADAGEPIHFSLTAVGTQRMDKLGPWGTRIKMLRHLEKLDGTPLQDGAVKVGEVFRVRLQLELTQREAHVMIGDRRPAGCEFADDRIDGLLAGSAAHVEFHDDRLCVFHTSLPAGRHEVIYYLRAETHGTSHVLPGCAYPMYDESARGETGADLLQVK